MKQEEDDSTGRLDDSYAAENEYDEADNLEKILDSGSKKGIKNE